MDKFLTLYKKLNLDTRLIKLAMGETPFPNSTIYAPFSHYGFPPALIPLWSEVSGPSYTGIWKRWFSERQYGFVQYHLGLEDPLSEIAMTVDQLLLFQTLSLICIYEGITSEVQQFANQNRISELQLLDEISMKVGDDYIALYNNQNLFGEKLPLRALTNNKEEYKGIFPNVVNPTPYHWAGLVVSASLKGKLEKRQIALPPWLTQEKKQPLFYQYLSDEDWEKAWLTLNSKGWMFADTRKALTLFAKKIENLDFQLHAEAWLSIKQDKHGGY